MLEHWQGKVMRIRCSLLHVATALLLLGSSAGSAAFGAQSDPAPAPQQADLQQQLIAADHALFNATAGPRPDVEKYQQMLAPDYVDIEFGTVHSRKEDIDQVRVMRDFSIDYKNPHAVVLSPTSGYVLADVRYSGVINGGGIQNHVLSTTVYSLEQGKWLAHLQMSQPYAAASKSTAAVPDSDPTLFALRALASQVEAQVHVPGYPAFAPPKVMLDAGVSVSYFSYGDQTVHEAQFADLPAPMQGIWNQWAAYTTDQPTGKALFDDMFHRFFFVHELGHWMASQVIAGLPNSEMSVVAKNEAGHMWEREVAANRIAVAWYREHDPQYLAKLVRDFRSIQAHLPNPVPAGIDKKTYFTDNYQKLGADPMAYGWYQLQMVLVVYDEPVRSFQQVLDALPKNRYE
jgi:hypothetical protein